MCDVESFSRKTQCLLYNQFENKLLTVSWILVKPTNRPMTYSNTRDEFKNLVKKSGLTQKKLKLHGLRSGGASAAANVGVPDRIIQKQGRWKTVSVKNDYIKENISKFSSITSEILSKR